MITVPSTCGGRLGPSGERMRKADSPMAHRSTTTPASRVVVAERCAPAMHLACVQCPSIGYRSPTARSVTARWWTSDALSARDLAILHVAGDFGHENGDQGHRGRLGCRREGADATSTTPEGSALRPRSGNADRSWVPGLPAGPNSTPQSNNNFRRSLPHRAPVDPRRHSAGWLSREEDKPADHGHVVRRPRGPGAWIVDGWLSRHPRRQPPVNNRCCGDQAGAGGEWLPRLRVQSAEESLGRS